MSFECVTSSSYCELSPMDSIQKLFILILDLDSMFQFHLLVIFIWPILVSFSLLVLHQLCDHDDEAHILVYNQLPES